MIVMGILHPETYSDHKLNASSGKGAEPSAHLLQVTSQRGVKEAQWVGTADDGQRGHKHQRACQQPPHGTSVWTRVICVQHMIEVSHHSPTAYLCPTHGIG